MRKLILCIFILSFTYAQNVVAESDSTKPIALDAVEVLAESKSITSGMFLRNAEPSDVVSKSELDQFRYTDIHRIVGRIPGVYISEEDGLGLRPNIGVRGTGSLRMEKLLLSALSNWETKNEGKRIEDSQLYVSEVKVDSGRMLKRIQPAPQGRAHRIRKRSNHVTLFLEKVN